jgi:hypothetical protein
MALTEIPIELSSTPSIVDGGNATAITIDSSENVGIGTSSPSKKFVVSEGGAHGFEISPFDGSQNATRLINYNRNTNEYFPLEIEASQIQFETASTERLRIGSTGIIYVNGDGTGGRISGDGSGGLNLQDGNGRQTFKIMSPSSGSTQAMTLDASGNLAISATTYEGSATSNASSVWISSAGYISCNINNDWGLGINRTGGTNGAFINFRKNGADIGYIGTTTSAGGTRLAIGGNSDPGIIFAGTGVFPAIGLTASDNTINLGSANYRFKNVHLSGGVVFGDAGGSGTSSSNTLDEYEEGTATISILAASTNPSISQGNTFTGYYTRVGNVCTIIGYTGLRNFTNTGSGNIRFSGLPFASKSGPYAIAQFTHNTFFTNSTAGYVETGSSYFYPIVDNATPVAAIAGTGARYLMFSLTYLIA